MTSEQVLISTLIFMAVVTIVGLLYFYYEDKKDSQVINP